MNDMINEQGTPKGLSLQELEALLQQEPSAQDIEQHTELNVKIDGKWVPYEFIPLYKLIAKLSNVFGFMGYSWQIIETREVINEIIVQVRLTINFNGITKIIDGAGASMVMVRKGTEIAIENKIKNTLGKDYPNAVARAQRNACKQLGPFFGSNLNKGASAVNSWTGAISKKDTVLAIGKLQTQADVEQFIKDNAAIQNEDYFRLEIRNKKAELKALPAQQAGEQLTIGS